ncbi:hypothetical protein NWF24_07805 [Variovorax paradoxus]|uniref:hypothetical protein n=1 Tax=Variovorax paradoxus TaxID=34073 RepID=UPI0021AD1B28|nr:hypothetical protein [Variovorax paradoxus]UVH59306.1 hypothetical protein NWF24_07805 [Variovorax paradoxus]
MAVQFARVGKVGAARLRYHDDPTPRPEAQIRSILNMNNSLSLPLDLLERILPGATLQPDSILAAAERRGLAYKFVAIPNWAQTEAQYGKTDLFDLIFAGKPLPPGEVVVVADGSFISGELLCCAVDELRQRVSLSSQFMFDGDVVFMWPQVAGLTVFHHEGGFTHIGW